MVEHRAEPAAADPSESSCQTVSAPRTCQAADDGRSSGREESVRKQSRQLGLAGLAMIAVSYGFARYGYGLFLPEIRHAFGLSIATAGLIASVTYMGYLIALSLAGLLASRVGPRPLIVTSGLVAAAGMTLIAIAPTTTILIVGAALAGTSSGWAWAPYSDAVARTVSAARQGRTLSIISTGTTFGVLVAGPAALLAGPAWRTAWFAFAAITVVVTAWNAWLLPTGPHGDDKHSLRRLGWRWFLRATTIPLFIVAFAFGLVGAVYWSFSADLVVRATGASAATQPVLWTVIGLGGIAGVLTGDAIARVGLARVLTVILAGLGIAIGLLGAAPSAWPALASSAVLYGASFMAMAALLATWSSQVFPEQPSTGFSATVFFLGLGSIVGPAAMGAIGGQVGLRTVFLITAALTLITLFVRPKGTNSHP